MALASLDGKLEEYASMADQGLNTLELDVKDENGEVAFRSPQAKLATKVGAAKNYYKPAEAVKLARDHGLYLIGRVVVFEDPVLSMKRPALAIRRTDGGIWTTSAGLGWTNPYDERVWKYNVDIAAAAARAGFDEIMFDYVRFPSDGDLAAMVFNHQVKEPKAETMVRFVKYARSRLHPLGVRVSAAVFGLSATRDLGIGQRPAEARPVPRCDLPDGLSLPLQPGRVQHRQSGRGSRPDGCVLAPGLPREAARPTGEGRSLAPGLLPPAHVHAGPGPGSDRLSPPGAVGRLPALERVGRLHRR